MHEIENRCTTYMYTCTINKKILINIVYTRVERDLLSVLAQFLQSSMTPSLLALPSPDHMEEDRSRVREIYMVRNN